ncbi:MAG: protein translocase subunit SecF [Fidelibacterota bacterium]
MRLLKETKIDFMSQKRAAFSLSGVLVLAGLLSLIINGGPKLSIDFKGGTLVAVQFSEPVDIAPVRQALATTDVNGQVFDFSNAEIKHFGTPSTISIRIAALEDEPDDLAHFVVQHLYNSFPNKVPDEVNSFLLTTEKVGPKIGAELSGKAIMAIISALFLILVYISIRFEFKFAIGAIIALIHDVLITLGLFSILDYEISLSIIAAFLTIVGYSLNDTIVIFDRIRENLKARKRESYSTVINHSINQSLSRTIITSLTTFFVVLILWVSGGEVIHNFAFAMIVGVVVGTYSSIYIASTIVEWMHVREKT